MGGAGEGKWIISLGRRQWRRRVAILLGECSRSPKYGWRWRLGWPRRRRRRTAQINATAKLRKLKKFGNDLVNRFQSQVWRDGNGARNPQNFLTHMVDPAGVGRRVCSMQEGRTTLLQSVCYPRRCRKCTD